MQLLDKKEKSMPATNIEDAGLLTSAYMHTCIHTYIRANRMRLWGNSIDSTDAYRASRCYTAGI